MNSTANRDWYLDGGELGGYGAARPVRPLKERGLRMSVRPAAAPSSPSLAEMERMVGQAGLTLNAGQMADLVLAWRQMVGLLARIPRKRPLLDDQAYVFRVPPPGAPVAAPPATRLATRPPAKPARASASKGRPA